MGKEGGGSLFLQGASSFLSSPPTQFHKGLFQRRGTGCNGKYIGVGIREILVHAPYLSLTSSMTLDWSQALLGSQFTLQSGQRLDAASYGRMNFII